jgi:hypothetical protein
VAYENDTLHRLRGKVRKTKSNDLSQGDIVTSKKTDEMFRNGDQLTVKSISKCVHKLDDIPACISRSEEVSFSGFLITFAESEDVAFMLEDKEKGKSLARKVRSQLLNRKIPREQAIRILDWIDSPQEFELSALATIHKSQGRSVDTVYVDTATVLIRPDQLSPVHHKRLLYTAITRARKNVVFYKKTGYCELPVSNVIEIARHPAARGEVPPLSALAA